MAETFNLKDQIQTLVKLQHLDAQIYSLAKEKDQLPLEIVRIEKNFEDKKAALLAFEEKSKALALKRKEKELNLSSQEERIKKLNAQLTALKTNKEYQTMLGEIASVKTDASLLEEETLKIMDEQDSLKEEIIKEKAHLTEEEKKFQEEKRKIEVRIKEIESAVTDLTAKRSHSIPLIEKRILSTYERVLKAKEGSALVAVKDFSCQGCFMAVTPQVVNEIKMREKLITCESCARILYLEEDM